MYEIESIFLNQAVLKNYDILNSSVWYIVYKSDGGSLIESKNVATTDATDNASRLLCWQ